MTRVPRGWCRGSRGARNRMAPRIKRNGSYTRGMNGSSIAFRSITPKRRVARRDGVTISIVSLVTTKRPRRSLSLTRFLMGFPSFTSLAYRPSRYDWFHVGPWTETEPLASGQPATSPRPEDIRHRQGMGEAGLMPSLPNNPTAKSTLFPSGKVRNVLSLRRRIIAVPSSEAPGC